MQVNHTIIFIWYNKPSNNRLSDQVKRANNCSYPYIQVQYSTVYSDFPSFARKCSVLLHQAQHKHN